MILSRTIKFSVFSLILMLCTLVSAQIKATTVYGKNSSYVGQILSVDRLAHQLFHDPIVLDTVRVDADGQFIFSFSLPDTCFAGINIGRSYVQFVIIPGDSLELRLPDYIPLKKEDRYNPYFKAEPYLILPEKGKSRALNQELLIFEDRLDQHYNEALQDAYFYQDCSTADSLFKQYYEVYETGGFVETYKRYSAYSLFKMANPYADDALLQYYFSSIEPSYANPAFWSAFNAQFENPFFMPNDNTIISAFERNIWLGNWDELIVSLQHYYGIENRKMAEVMALKGLYASWYKVSDFQPMFTVLINQGLNEIEEDPIRLICAGLKLHLLGLMKGSTAPYYELPGKGEALVPTSLTGRFVVLGFGSPELLECKRDYLELESMAKKYADYLQVVNVVVHQPKHAFLEFVSSYQGQMKFAHWNDNYKLLQDYHVTGFPLYYLIGPDNKLLVSKPLLSAQSLVEALENTLAQ